MAGGEGGRLCRHLFVVGGGSICLEPDDSAVMLSLRTTSDGVVVPVRVISRSSRTQVAQIRDGRLAVRLTAPPVDGAANAALIRLLAKTLRVPRRAVRIVTGERARQKGVLIEGLTADELRDRLGECV